MTSDMIVSQPYPIKRLSDNKVLQVRTIKQANDKDFDIVWQLFEFEEWVTLTATPYHLEYSFDVSEKEKRGLQLFMEF